MFGALPTRRSGLETDMASVSHDDVEPVTDHVHENSWSANLEQPEHGDDRSLVLAHAVDAVEKTAAGHHVNLVTHGDHGHPDGYLFDALDDEFDGSVDYEYVEQCGCGGHVTRVQVTA
jgi:putative CGCGG family rSAM target protein